MADPQAAQKVDLSGYQSTPPAGAPPAAGGAEPPSFLNTLGREVGAFGSSVNPVNIAKSVYHMASDKPTTEESAKYGSGEGPNAHWYLPNMKNIGPTGRVIVRGVAEPVENAAQWYYDAAKGKHGDLSSVESQMLDVAPEAMGTAGGNVALLKAVQTGTNIVKGANPATEIIGERTPGGTPLPFRGVTAPVVRGGAKALNVATQKLPEVAGGALGAGAGELIAGPKGAAIGGAVGAGAGRALRGVIPAVPEDLGLSTMEKQGVTNPDVLRPQDMAAGRTGMPAVKGAIENVPQRGVPKTYEELGLRPRSATTAVQLPGGGIAHVGEMPPVKPMGTSVTPEEVASVEHVGGAKTGDVIKPTESAATSEDVNKTAQEEVEKMNTNKPKLGETEQRQFEHRLGKQNTDLMNDEGGVDLARKLLKGTNKQVADTGSYLGVKGSGPNGELMESDIARSTSEHGKGLNPKKLEVIKAIRESDDPHSLVGHWGAK